MKLVYSLVTVIILLQSCTREDFSDCEGKESSFLKIWAELESSGKKAEETWDVQLHSYIFEITDDKEVCLIGYEANRGHHKGEYLIEIFNETDSILLYSEFHRFKSSKMSYEKPFNKLLVKANKRYSIRRYAYPRRWISETVGKMINVQYYPWSSSNLTFPVIKGQFIIHGTYFQGVSRGQERSIMKLDAIEGGSYLPYIDIVFK